eukprot:TRINITY_DN32470_c0_g1_i1.p1 TRINITY_DN32470_c0_g1~~TRINITY_DN32470_c0_g1_i1.p1  ORF type:complete len:424 (+),score=86.33 TRINITY_DN32470_c0_g1_i1:3-1274(+)
MCHRFRLLDSINYHLAMGMSQCQWWQRVLAFVFPCLFRRELASDDGEENIPLVARPDVDLEAGPQQEDKEVAPALLPPPAPAVLPPVAPDVPPPVSPAAPVPSVDAIFSDSMLSGVLADNVAFCTSLGGRKSQEDCLSFVDFHGTQVLCVADGHSGSSAGRLVASRLPELILGHPLFKQHGQLEEVIHTCFDDCEKEVLAMVKSEAPAPVAPSADEEASSRSGGGDPAASCVSKMSSGAVTGVLISRGEEVTVGWAGDVRICASYGAGDVRDLTRDHQPHDEAEKKRLELLGYSPSSDGYLHGKIAVSRSLGDYINEEGTLHKIAGVIHTPEVTVVEDTSSMEFAVIGCDGVFEKLSSKEVCTAVRRTLRMSGDAVTAAEKLVELASRSGSTDNLTAIIKVYKMPPPMPTTTKRPAFKLDMTQ